MTNAATRSAELLQLQRRPHRGDLPDSDCFYVQRKHLNGGPTVRRRQRAKTAKCPDIHRASLLASSSSKLFNSAVSDAISSSLAQEQRQRWTLARSNRRQSHRQLQWTGKATVGILKSCLSQTCNLSIFFSRSSYVLNFKKILFCNMFLKRTLHFPSISSVSMFRSQFWHITAQTSAQQNNTKLATCSDAQYRPTLPFGTFSSVILPTLIGWIKNQTNLKTTVILLCLVRFFVLICHNIERVFPIAM